MMPVLLVLVGCSSASFPAKPLYAGLANENYASGSRLIEGRLKQQFPIGSPGSAFAGYLRTQGMMVGREKFGPPQGNAWSATIRYEALPCGSQIMVNWTTDAAQKIVQMNARYGDTGCP